MGRDQTPTQARRTMSIIMACRLVHIQTSSWYVSVSWVLSYRADLVFLDSVMLLPTICI
jgi:hypothetical protein